MCGRTCPGCVVLPGDQKRMSAPPLWSRGESSWCWDMTSTHGVWRHTEVQFLLSGEGAISAGSQSCFCQADIGPVALWPDVSGLFFGVEDCRLDAYQGHAPYVFGSMRRVRRPGPRLLNQTCPVRSGSSQLCSGSQPPVLHGTLLPYTPGQDRAGDLQHVRLTS